MRSSRSRNAMEHDPVSQTIARIRESRRFAVTSHLRPDGDSICTGLALALMGELLGKETAVINHDPTPFPFSLLPDASLVRVGLIDPSEFDLVVLLECADVSRSGQDRLGDCRKVNIDHHYSTSLYADVNWINAEAAAVGEMVFELAERMDLRLTPRIANHLYCAIVSDTGSFQFSNTSAKALETCARLARLGANPIQVSEALYNNNPPEKVKLLGQVLASLTMNERGTIAVITMFRHQLESLSLRETDTEDITTLARSIKGLEMVLFFKELEPDVFRVSCRSKGKANAALVAEHYGGGGHVHASGFTVTGPYERLVREVPATVEKLLASGAASS